ncbi:2-keto-4-pentenoate hydratase [Henriciella mobilis]|uniref:Fumarylacetoacetase-like C-terminal domain-containing protein n=1 Tax=Henriciella mobilis TaxID=2305467 RepID=A0A399RAS3_9PROT|nr:fumarylacetoacetate hydrolase family protein [Henriciella mobilis]RIJ26842.1 hypothetical protein D1223_18055 [Henriciella mobilis]
MAANVETAAGMLFDAQKHGRSCEPVRSLLEGHIDAAYQVQTRNFHRRLDEGHKLVGRKIGLTTLTAQKAFNADAPDQGFLLSDMMYASGACIPWQGFIEPLAEVELAFRMAATVESLPSFEEFPSLLAEISLAVEIVDSRIAGWKIDLTDMIADNGAAGAFVIGDFMLTEAVRSSGLNGSVFCQIGQNRSEQVLTEKAIDEGAEAAYWLAGKAIELGVPLQKGEIILSGSLMPPVKIRRGASVRTGIERLGSLDFTLGR